MRQVWTRAAGTRSTTTALTRSRTRALFGPKNCPCSTGVVEAAAYHQYSSPRRRFGRPIITDALSSLQQGGLIVDQASSRLSPSLQLASTISRPGTSAGGSLVHSRTRLFSSSMYANTNWTTTRTLHNSPRKSDSKLKNKNKQKSSQQRKSSSITTNNTDLHGLQSKTTLAPTIENGNNNQEEEGAEFASSDLYDPHDLYRGPPKTLSPSSIVEFQKCPQSFLFQYVLGLKQSPNRAMVKGTMIHAALEQVFDLEPQDRSLETLQNLFRSEWNLHRLKSPYKELFEETTTTEHATADDQNDDHASPRRQVEAERAWGIHALKLLKNYHALDQPHLQGRGPAYRERWVTAHLPTIAGHPTNHASTTRVSAQDASNNKSTVFVRGIVDRLELTKEEREKNQGFHSPGNGHSNVQERRRSKEVFLRLCDYKTGKAPVLKYAAWMNEKIRNEAFFQLKIYALLLRYQKLATTETKQTELVLDNNDDNRNQEDGTIGAQTPSIREGTMDPETDPSSPSIDLRYLRLFYLTTTSTVTNDDNYDGMAESKGDADKGGNDRAAFIDLDLGRTQEERDTVLMETHQQVSQVWKEIVELCDLNDFTAWKGCNRSFCYCHKCRPRFRPGTVWEPPTSVVAAPPVNSQSKTETAVNTKTVHTSTHTPPFPFASSVGTHSTPLNPTESIESTTTGPAETVPLTDVSPAAQLSSETVKKNLDRVHTGPDGERDDDHDLIGIHSTVPFTGNRIEQQGLDEDEEEGPFYFYDGESMHPIP